MRQNETNLISHSLRRGPILSSRIYHWTPMLISTLVIYWTLLMLKSAMVSPSLVLALIQITTINNTTSETRGLYHRHWLPRLLIFQLKTIKTSYTSSWLLQRPPRTFRMTRSLRHQAWNQAMGISNLLLMAPPRRIRTLDRIQQA